MTHLGQLHDGGQQGLAQLLDPDNLVHAVKVGDDVQPHLEKTIYTKYFLNLTKYFYLRPDTRPSAVRGRAAGDARWCCSCRGSGTGP